MMSELGPSSDVHEVEADGAVRAILLTLREI